MKQLKKDLYQNRIAIIVVILYIIATQLIFGRVCMIKIITHYDCPGCGLTRACLSLLLFRFKDSWNYHPAASLWIISIGLFLFDRYIHKIKINIIPHLFNITGIVTLVVYLIKIF